MGMALGMLGSIGAAAALVGVRGEVSSANVALVLVAFVLLGALVGGRVAGAASAVTAAMAFDFFHTVPYNSLKISRSDDVQTMVILLGIGVVVGEIGAWARRGRTAMKEDRMEIRRIHRVAEMAARGDSVEDLALSVTAEISSALSLRDCWFDRSASPQVLPRLQREGRITGGTQRYGRGGVELPPEGIELGVVGRGKELGHFVLVPTPGELVSLERRMIAVALADQLGQVMAMEPEAR
jgi:uncharacterized protein DUF4118